MNNLTIRYPASKRDDQSSVSSFSNDQENFEFGKKSVKNFFFDEKFNSTQYQKQISLLAKNLDEISGHF